MCENKSFSPFFLRCGSRIIRYETPAVMGILNATADSFYDGGRYQTDAAVVERAVRLAAEGADIIDIGVVSTRPGATLLAPDEEAMRLRHAVELVRRELPDAVISVDTCYSLPAKAAFDAGAEIINDISGGAFDSAMFQTVADLHAPYILTHNPYGSATDPAGTAAHKSFTFSDFCLHLSTLVEKLHLLGVADVIVDPGFGFSKTLQENYELYGHLVEIRQLFPNNPLLVAVSRKSMIYKLLEITPDDALTGTIALHAAALLAGAQLIRVHDVASARQTIRVIGQIQGND